MNLLSIIDFTGRLHPLLVHLPIGILLLACFFQWLTIKDKFAFLQPAIPVALFWGMISAVASCISGYILSDSGDYDATLVNRHQWLGISVAISSLVLYLLYQFSIGERTARWASLFLVILISITGHLGGSLTHGSDYLTEGFNQKEQKGPAIKPIANVPEAVLYTDAIQPLLQARCYSCHGPNKKKGKLRLDTPEFIMLGGEDGKAVVAGKPDEGEMMKRLLLPLNNKDHMAPSEKPQLTKNEIELLNWWVSTGASFTKKIKELPQTDKIKPVLDALQTGSSASDNSAADIPQADVKKADDVAIAKLKNAGVIIVPVTQNSNYLSASFVTASTGTDTLLKLLQPLQQQLIWLNLGNSSITDTGMQIISKLANITRLHLNNTSITDNGLAQLKADTNLHYINLVHTSVTAKGVSELKTIKSLRSIYLYQSAVGTSDWPALKKLFPKTTLDSGGYVVPTLVSDTTEVKEKKATDKK
ncbi:MAG: c-type cytochrome domain-containing protein [Bacteroidota bacterium]